MIVLTASLLTGRTRKGDEYLKEGAKAELLQDYDAALQLYDYALEEDSHEPVYLKVDQRARRLYIRA